MILPSVAWRPIGTRALRASGQASLTVSSTDTPPVFGTWTKRTLRESLISTRRGYPTVPALLPASRHPASRRDDDWLPLHIGAHVAFSAALAAHLSTNLRPVILRRML